MRSLCNFAGAAMIGALHIDDELLLKFLPIQLFYRKVNPCKSLLSNSNSVLAFSPGCRVQELQPRRSIQAKELYI